MKIEITQFQGAFPAVHPEQLTERAATVAQNTDFSAASLRPLLGRSAVSGVSVDAGTKALYHYRHGGGAYWLQFPDVVDVISSPIKDDTNSRLYWSGDSRGSGDVLFSYFPHITDSPQVRFKLGIPAPTAPASITSFDSGVSGTSDESRTYAYTWVNAIGEESPPSPPSVQVIVFTTGASVVLSIPSLPPAVATGRQITKIRLYRSIVGSTGAASFALVTELPIATATYTDTYATTELNGAELVTTNYDPPRSGLQGLGLTAYGVAYGFTEKIVCLSQPFHVYAWPRDYELTTQYRIVAMGHFDNSIVAATEGTPVMITGIDPSQGLSMMEIPLNEPCASKRSMVSMGHAAIYASPRGLVMVSGNGAQLITQGLFTLSDWQAMNPASVHAIEHRGRYVAFWKSGDTSGAFSLDPLNLQAGVMVLPWSGDFAIRDLPDDQMMVLQGGAFWSLDDRPSAEKSPYVWRSKVFRVGGTMGNRLLAARVLATDYQDIALRVWADGHQIADVCPSSGRVLGLRVHSPAQTYQLELSGTSEVSSVILASTPGELR